MEEALYDSRTMRLFAGIDLGEEPAPDETMSIKLSQLLEAHNLGEKLFQSIGENLGTNGLKVSKATIVDTPGVDLFSWIPDDLIGAVWKWARRGNRIRRSSDNRWSSWYEPDAPRCRRLGSLNHGREHPQLGQAGRP